MQKEVTNGPTYKAIERVERPSVEEFHRLYGVPGKPVVITGAMSGWKAMSQWSHEWFKDEFGSETVRLSVNPRHTDRMMTMRLADYVDRILSGTDDKLYMDQYLVDQLPALANYFEVPVYCHPDRERVINLWLGPAGTVLGFHKDNHHPNDYINNIFAQICGRKRVVLAGADQDPYMYQRSLGETDYWHSHIHDPESCDLAEYPLFRKATLFETAVHPGEMLFIPGNYWHHVRALDKSISMSFWWRRDRLADIILRLMRKPPSERSAFVIALRGAITMADVEAFGGIGKLTDALEWLGPHLSYVLDLFDASVRAQVIQLSNRGRTAQQGPQ
jgi:hypothetical protein